MEVPAGGFTAAWEVLVEDFGIGMSAVLHPEAGGAPVEVMAMQKIKSDSGLAVGSFPLPTKGKLLVTFDNSYSILRSKTFNYKIGVVDSNHSPEGIDYVIPGNDDSSKAVTLYARGIADAVLEGRANAVDDLVKAVVAEGEDEFVEVDVAA